MPRLKRAQDVRRPRPISRRVRFAGIGLVAMAVLGGATWAWTSGRIQSAAQAVGDGAVSLTVRFGLRVEEVLVDGRSRTPADDLLTALDVSRGDPILAIDLEAARLALEDLPWVSQAQIARRLPDTLLVEVGERRPMAIWQLDQRLHLIDAEGTVLADDGLEAFDHLPLVVGHGAADHATPFLAQIAETQVLAGRVHAAVRVGGRRWDLHLVNGVTVQLPEDGVASALAKLAQLHDEAAVLDRDVVVIDMRLPDRAFIRVSPLAHERWQLPEEST